MEKLRIKLQKNLINTSKEITTMFKKNPKLCESGYIQLIKKWCKNVPINSQVIDTWILLDQIKGMFLSDKI